MRPILTVPGYQGSGPDHWQTIFEHKLPAARRVEMPSWTKPVREEWVRALEDAVSACAAPPVLVAHSLGCIAVAHWAATTRHPIQAALLVVPCDLERPGLPEALRDFAPAPLEELAFPSLLVASTDDPYLNVARAQHLADRWGSWLRVLGARGHINAASGHGPWFEGESLLAELL
jgi:hypothetical protein